MRVCGRKWPKRFLLSAHDVKLWKGQGCEKCSGQGYRGRIAIYEFFLMKDELAEAIAHGNHRNSIERKSTPVWLAFFEG
jgi:type II secretory ATPase GspE/PulE/Tfp pilus assembly ATPase PilB-like protein